MFPVMLRCLSALLYQPKSVLKHKSKKKTSRISVKLDI